MKRLGFGLLFAFGGYFVTALSGYFLIELMSSNAHDRSVEAAMTSAFVIGPLGSAAGFIVGFIRGGRNNHRAGPDGNEEIPT